MKRIRGLSYLIAIICGYSLVLSSYANTDPNSTISHTSNAKISEIANIISSQTDNVNTTWQLWRKSDTLAIYYRNVQGNELVEIKANATVKSTLSGFLLFILDIDLVPQWLDNVNSIALIDSSNNDIKANNNADIDNIKTSNGNVFRIVFKTFWPIAARDMVLKSYYRQADDLTITIDVTDVGQNFAKNSTDIRVEVFRARWQVMPISLDKILVEYIFLADPKGSVPKWLTNQLTLNSIWRTLENLEQQLPRSKWQKAPFNAIKNTP